MANPANPIESFKALIALREALEKKDEALSYGVALIEKALESEGGLSGYDAAGIAKKMRQAIQV